ncbi:YggT family protein [Halonatronum saccharophilum]|uniref:YggT family protein n=1 Tax=Halonatronum saccharophilum TaxID=150060 RepID=UPI0004873D2B|nr:YggT family protein [Halonatronum saccharophilum]
MLLIRGVNLIFQFYYYLILVRVIASWVQPPTHHKFMKDLLKFTYKMTEPILAPFRELIPLGPIDISPIIALIVLQIIRRGLINLLIYL